VANILGGELLSLKAARNQTAPKFSGRLGECITLASAPSAKRRIMWWSAQGRFTSLCLKLTRDAWDLGFVLYPLHCRDRFFELLPRRRFIARANRCRIIVLGGTECGAILVIPHQGTESMHLTRARLLLCWRRGRGKRRILRLVRDNRPPCEEKARLRFGFQFEVDVGQR